jgi:hypothetical protein
MYPALISAMNFLLNSKKPQKDRVISAKGKVEIDKLNSMSLLEAIEYLKKTK